MLKSFTCEVTPQATKCWSNSLSWWASTFSARLSTLSGGLGKYSNQCWHQFTVKEQFKTQSLSAVDRIIESLPKRPLGHHPTPHYCPALPTNDGGHYFKADQWIVLEQLDKWEGQQREIISLSKDGSPVSKSRQHSARLEMKRYT